MTLVDGCESAYRYNSRLEYLEAAQFIRGGAQDLVSPENRAKYRAQVQTGFGVYLDAYWNSSTSPWYIDGLGQPRTERLRSNVATALRVADEYVWVYGEKFRWWPTPNGRVQEQTWPETLPGCERVLRYVRDPVEYARREIARLKVVNQLTSLARNGQFDADEAVSLEGQLIRYVPDGPPAGWSAWQADTSHGQFTWDRQVDYGDGQGAARDGQGAARITGVEQGCFLQSIRVEPGQRYVFAAKVRQQGAGEAALRIRWQRVDGTWVHENLDQTAFPEIPSGRTEPSWLPVFGVVEVPDDAGRLVILLGASGQLSQTDAVWYEDVELFRLPD